MTLLNSYTPGQIEFIKFLHTHRKDITVYNECSVCRKDLVSVLQNSPYIAVPAWIACDKTRRVGRGHYLIPEINTDPATLTVNANKRGRKPGSRNQKGRVDPATDTDTTPVTTEASA